MSLLLKSGGSGIDVYTWDSCLLRRYQAGLFTVGVAQLKVRTGEAAGAFIYPLVRRRRRIPPTIASEIGRERARARLSFFAESPLIAAAVRPRAMGFHWRGVGATVARSARSSIRAP